MKTYKIFSAIISLIIAFGMGWFIFWGIKWYLISQIISKHQDEGNPDWGNIDIMWNYVIYLSMAIPIIFSALIFVPFYDKSKSKGH